MSSVVQNMKTTGAFIALIVLFNALLVMACGNTEPTNDELPLEQYVCVETVRTQQRLINELTTQIAELQADLQREKDHFIVSCALFCNILGPEEISNRAIDELKTRDASSKVEL